MKTVKTFLTLSPDGNPNTDLVGVEAHRAQHGNIWIVDKIYRCGPNPSSEGLALNHTEWNRVYSFLDAQEELNAKNAETSRQEVEAFRRGLHLSEVGPNKYHAYLDEKTQKITNWNGDVLADVVWLGKPFQCPGLGGISVRQNFRAKGIDDRIYAGTYFSSAGNYVRMRPIKSKP